MDDKAFKSVWRGLDPYREEDSGNFFGRDAEAEKLAAEVMQTPLCVIYGASGAGKTSLLRAGVFPRLRSRGLIPVYVLFDHSAKARPYAEQVEAAVIEAVRTAHCEVSEVCGPISTSRAETLWEWFHRHAFQNAFRQTVNPVVVIDQFEEVFTVGEERVGADPLLSELSDLAENNVPDVVVRDMETAENGFGFAAEVQNWRIAIGLREDFLPRLEERTAHFPIFRRNRFAVGAFSREQALMAVTGPGGALCSQEVAEAIVDAVGKTKAERQASVEPALLSLFCMRLDRARQEAGLGEITLSLVQGKGKDILNDFYEEAMGGVSEKTRDLLEDWLLTASGYRDSMAIEDAEAEGVSQRELDRLVRDRLLHVEYRGGVRWLELSHDILAPVARDARDRRARAREGEKARLKSRFYSRLSIILGGAVALFLIVAQTWWFVFEKEYSSIYREWVRVYGNPVGIGKPLKANEWRHRECSFRLHRKGALWWKRLCGSTPEIFKVEAINGRGELTTKHKKATHLWEGGSESSEDDDDAERGDSACGKQTKEAMESVCAWRFERSEVKDGQGTLSRPSTVIALDKNGNKVWIFRYIFDSDNCIDWRKNAVLGNYMWPSGLSMRQRNDHAENVQINYDEDGHETLVEFFDNAKRHTPGPDGSFAQKYTFDNMGRKKTQRSLGWDEGNKKYTNMMDRAGNCGHNYFYSDSQGNDITEALSVDIDGKAWPTKIGYDQVKQSYDEWGNCTNQVFFRDGQVVALTNAMSFGMEGVSQLCYSYDDFGFLERQVALALPDRGGLFGLENLHKFVMECDENGDWVKMSGFDESDCPTSGFASVPVIMRKYGKPGECLLEWYEDGYGMAATNNFGIARSTSEYLNGVRRRGDEFALPGRGGMLGCSNVHHRVSLFDERGNLIEDSLFSVEGLPTHGEDNVHMHRYSYASFDGVDRCVEGKFFDEQGRPAADLEGAVCKKMKYDDTGKYLIRQELIAAEKNGGVNGLPALNRQVMCYSCNNENEMKEDFNYGVDGEPVAGEYGYWHGKVAYYDNGEKCVIEAWAPPGKGGVMGYESVNHLVEIYNQNGEAFVRLAFGTNGCPVKIDNQDMYVRNFDSDGRMIGEILLGPKNNCRGYATRHSENGRDAFYDETGKSVPVESVVVVRSVDEGYPAEKAGVRKNDIVLLYGEYSFLRRKDVETTLSTEKLQALSKIERDVWVARFEEGEWGIRIIHLPIGMAGMHAKDDCPVAISEIEKIEDLFYQRLQQEVQ